MSAPVKPRFSILGLKAPEYLSAEEEWVKFKEDFKIKYGEEEDQKRFAIFKENLQRINDHNETFKKGETTWIQGITQFADMTADECKQQHNSCCGFIVDKKDEKPLYTSN